MGNCRKILILKGKDAEVNQLQDKPCGTGQWETLLILISAVLGNLGIASLCYGIVRAGSSREHTVVAPILAFISMAMFVATFWDAKDMRRQKLSVNSGIVCQLVYLCLILVYR